MRKNWMIFGLACVLGCGGQTSTLSRTPIAAASGSDDGIGAQPDFGGWPTPPPGLDALDAGPGSSASDARSEASVIFSEAATIDASPSDGDASQIGSSDDGQTADASNASDAIPDVGSDSSSIDSCDETATKCVGVFDYNCTDGRWVPLYGPQTCCFTHGRFTVVGFGPDATVIDGTTGLVWNRYVTLGAIATPACTAPMRLPSLAELSGIVVGVAVETDSGYYSVCDPAMDQVAWNAQPPTGQSIADVVLLTSDSYAGGDNLFTGTGRPTNEPADGVLCVR